MKGQQGLAEYELTWSASVNESSAVTPCYVKNMSVIWGGHKVEKALAFSSKPEASVSKVLVFNIKFKLYSGCPHWIM